MALRGTSVGPSVRLETDGGGRPVVETDPPEVSEGFTAAFRLVDAGDHIEQVWDVVPASRAGDALAMAAIEARSLADAEAAAVARLFPAWYVGVPQYAAGERVERGGRLYRCLQTHQPRIGLEPETAVDLWERIDR